MVFLSLNFTKADYFGYGIKNSMKKNLEQLPLLRNNAILKMESSRDRAGKGTDGFANNFLYSKNGENFMVDTKGPGVAVRVWMLGFNEEDYLIFYIDSESEITERIKLKDYFSGESEYFPYPFTLNGDINSRGNVSYVDIPFNKSLKISVIGDGFYCIEYYILPSNIDINSWYFNKIDNNTKTDYLNSYNPNSQQIISKEYNVLKSKDSLKIAEINYAAIINQLKLTFNQLKNTKNTYNYFTDDGRSHQGKSGFTIKLNKNYDYISIKRRIDNCCGDLQHAQVFIDNQPYYFWLNDGFDIRYRWKYLDYYIDNSMFQNKSEIKVEFRFVSKGPTTIWNEYYFWIYGNDELIDSIDVGNINSEKAHKYFIENQISHDTLTSKEFISDNNRSKLNSLLDSCFLKFYWDEMQIPAVNIPLSHFFSVGALTNPESKSIINGIDSNSVLFNYFNMPFAKNAKLYLINNSSFDIDSLSIDIGLKENMFKSSDYGLFYSQMYSFQDTIIYKAIAPPGIIGEGHLVGVNINADGRSDIYLESNDVFYTDDLLTPYISGTGMEDFFNCGYYFRSGPVSHLFSGLSDALGSKRSMYRMFITDPIPFKSNLLTTYEYFNPYGNNPKLDISIFYYLNDKSSLILSDSLDVGNFNSEAIHNYNSTPSELINSIFSYEGGLKENKIEDNGRIVSNESSFTIKINKDNFGVRLYRRFDFGIENQEADVFVNGQYVGKWYNSGSNIKLRWRDDVFFIPQNISANNTSLNIKIINLNKKNNWTEYYYKAYSIIRKDTFVDSSNLDNSNYVSTLISPNPVSTKIFIHSSDYIHYELYDNKLDLIEKSIIDNHSISVEHLPIGIYFLILKNKDKSEFVKFIKID
jgi:hypothetical protein